MISRWRCSLIGFSGRWVPLLSLCLHVMNIHVPRYPLYLLHLRQILNENVGRILALCSFWICSLLTECKQDFSACSDHTTSSSLLFSVRFTSDSVWTICLQSNDCLAWMLPVFCISTFSLCISYLYLLNLGDNGPEQKHLLKKNKESQWKS